MAIEKVVHPFNDYLRRKNTPKKSMSEDGRWVQKLSAPRKTKGGSVKVNSSLNGNSTVWKPRYRKLL
jgi:hypothetical protein